MKTSLLGAVLFSLYLSVQAGVQQHDLGYANRFTLVSGDEVLGIYGSSDKEGAYPDDPVTVNDLHATIGWAAGLPLKKEVRSSSGRPFLVGGSRAKPVSELFS